MRERLLNKKDPGLASFENPQSPKIAKNAKIKKIKRFLSTIRKRWTGDKAEAVTAASG